MWVCGLRSRIGGTLRLPASAAYVGTICGYLGYMEGT